MPKHIYARHTTELEIPFFDVDSMHIVWHGHYVKYLEIARCAFLDKIGYNYLEMERYGYGWPIVKLNIKYIKPARFTQKIQIECLLTEYESCLSCDYIIRDATTGQKIAQASTMQVPVSIENGEMQFQTPESWQKAVKQLDDFTPL